MIFKIFYRMKNIYLDNAATTPLDQRVLDAMKLYLNERFGNASSVHQFGRDTKVLLEDARDVVAEFVGARSSEIYFTSGGTEANNFAIKGIAFNQLGKKNHIVSSRIEHSAVLDTLEYLKTRFGFEVAYLSNNKYGEIDLNELSDSITDNTFLVCVMHSNNELGIINDVPSIAKITNSKKVLLHSDSVQTLGKMIFNVIETGADTFTFSAHKIYGPKGIGALYIKKDTPIDKFIHGGKQERDRRGGTENIPAIAGFKKAIEILKAEMESDIIHYSKLRNKFLSGVVNEFGDRIIINSYEEISFLEKDLKESASPSPGHDASLPNIVNISFNTSKSHFDPESILIKLDLKGIAVSSGSACTSGSVQPSHVLKAIGYDDASAKSSLRISFGRFNTEGDVDILLEGLKEAMD
jgi:cysteine desulfurase